MLECVRDMSYIRRKGCHSRFASLSSLSVIVLDCGVLPPTLLWWHYPLSSTGGVKGVETNKWCFSRGRDKLKHYQAVKLLSWWWVYPPRIVCGRSDSPNPRMLIFRALGCFTLVGFCEQ